MFHNAIVQQCNEADLVINYLFHFRPATHYTTGLGSALSVMTIIQAGHQGIIT